MIHLVSRCRAQIFHLSQYKGVYITIITHLLGRHINRIHNREEIIILFITIGAIRQVQLPLYSTPKVGRWVIII